MSVVTQELSSQIAEGDEAPVLFHELTLTDLVLYAGASGDFFPVHHDEAAARAVGMPGVFGHGMLTAGLLSTAITNYVGVPHLRRFRVRFSNPTWPGERLRTRVRVVSVRRDGKERVVDLACEVLNDADQVKVSGDATARLPLR